MGKYFNKMVANKIKTAWLFPGQASQVVGMGKDLYQNTDIGKKYYNLANEILNFDIKSISFHGPDLELKKTKYTQPSIFIVSTIIGKILLENGHKTDGVAGHSLGEYSALTVANAFNFEIGLKLVKIRSESMHKAGKAQPGKMAAIIGIPSNDIEDICLKYSKGKDLAVAANYNTQNQIVISGNGKIIDEIVKDAKSLGAKLAIPLKVSGAFHSPLMSNARQALADELNSIDILDINIPLYTNVDAKPITKSADIKNSLLRQLENPVQWFKSINNMVKDNFTSFSEIGPGKVLQNLNRKIVPSIPINGFQSFNDIQNHEI